MTRDSQLLKNEGSSTAEEASALKATVHGGYT